MEQNWYQRGLEHLKAGDRQGALQALDHALRENPQSAEAYAKRAGIWADLGDRNRALADYHQALRLQPSPEAHLGRALVYLAIGETRAAIMDADQALRLNPASAAAYNLLGTAYRKLGEATQAIAAYKQATKLYLEQKDKASAQRCLDSISQLQPPVASRPLTPPATPSVLIDVNAFFQQAMEKVMQGNHRDALTDFNWLIRTDPQNAKAYCQRGIIYNKIGQRKEAIQDLTEAIRLAPHDPEMLFHRGMVRLELEDARGAIDDFNQLLGNNDPAVYLQRGNAYSQLQDYRQAIEDYSRALNLAPTNPDCYQQRGMAREAFGDRSGALNDLQQAANLWLNRGDGKNYERVLMEIRTLQASAPIQRSLDESSTQALDIPTLDRCSELWDQLLRLVGGNRGMAERLLDLAQENYPGRSDAWYLEKVIFDLEGDR